MENFIKGSVRRIFYQNDNGYMIGIFKLKYTNDENLTSYLNKTITFTGTFYDLKENNDYLFYGSLVKHPKYGMQYNVINYEQILPETKNGIIAFLSSGLFKGIGIKTATEIVETLGEKTLELILDDYRNLLVVPSLNEKKAKRIYEVLEKEASSYKTIVYLQGLGFTINEASKIYNHYKDKVMSVIEDNIYQLVEDIDGLGFMTVDKIALKNNIEVDDERRIEACILYVMSELCFRNGNTYNELEDIYLALSNYLDFNIELEPFNYHLSNLSKKVKIIIDDKKYYLKNYYEAEINNVLKIISLLKHEDNEHPNIEDYIKKIEEKEKIKYNQKQLSAIKNSIVKNFLIITGGPGTGKTTIIKVIIDLYIKMNKLTKERAYEDIALLAPTGRAAKRLKEATNFPAMTIHKFLKWNKETNDFKINEYNKASVKFVIVDEVSMIDNFLLNSLFMGLKNDIKLILVGDHNQLPSVGSGQVLKDLIESNKLPVIELDELYRQRENSYIITLAHKIRKGELSDEYKTNKDDYQFIKCHREEIKEVVRRLCEEAIIRNDNYKDIQVLVPMYKGLNGIDNMNEMLQNIFNPKDNNKQELEYQGIIYREGDKVLQIKNNNELGISNGDIGFIEKFIKVDDKTNILIDFDGEIVTYSLKEFEDITLGYAISIHKAQGSEFDIVIMPMDKSYQRMLYRKLIYTGITRTKKTLFLVGELEAFILGVKNVREEVRKTSLKEMIIKML